jgi:hypothetical protein
MGQWDQIECATVATQPERPAYDFVELLESKKLRNRKFADRDDEPRLQKIDFITHPRRTIPDLVRSWNAVPTCGGFPWETATNRGEVNLRAHLHFTQMTELSEPTEEGAASRPGERLAQNRFSYTRCLTDEHYLAENRSAGNRWRQHAGTTTALEQALDMLIQQLLSARCQAHCSRSSNHRRKNDKIRLNTMLIMRQVTIGK